MFKDFSFFKAVEFFRYEKSCPEFSMSYMCMKLILVEKNWPQKSIFF